MSSGIAFRHKEGARLALLSGHVVLVGKDWVELDPMFHHEAMIQGCEVNKNYTPPPPRDLTSSSDAVKPLDEDAVIKEALELIKARNEEGDMTAAGLPNLKVVARLAGIEVSKESVYRIWRELTPEANPPADPNAV